MIELRMLGTLTLIGDDGSEVRSLLAQPRRFALLAYLAAATPPGFRRRDTLVATFWPELDQDHARTALRQALRVLRAALTPSVIVNRGDDAVGLDFDRVWSDLGAFESAIRTDQRLDALDLYRGPLLDGFFISGAPEFERWLDAERSRLRDEASRVARTLAEDCAARGDLTRAVSYARRAFSLAPENEALFRQLITLLDRQGERASALEAYRDFARRIDHEYGAEPAAETKALMAVVRTREFAPYVRPPVSEPLADRRDTMNEQDTVEAELVRGAAAASPNDVPELTSRRAKRTRPRVAFGAMGLLALLAVLGGIQAVDTWHARSAGRPGDTWMHSIAVLPLENLSSDSAEDAFAAGMTAALIADLGRLHALRVIARQSIIPYKGTTRASSEIGRALHVDGLVQGTIQQTADTFRIDLQLIEASSGKQLWTQRFVGALQHRFAVQDSISRSIAAVLKLSITSAENLRLRRLPTRNVDAYDLFLRARTRMQRVTREDDSVAIGLLERAVVLDSSFALAHAWLAIAYIARIAQFAPNDSEALEQAFVYVNKALLIDSDLAEAHWVRARLFWGATRQFAHEQSVREDRRALELNPNLEVAHGHLGFIYLHVGLLDEAVAEFENALALDPGQRLILDRIGQIRLIQGRYEEGLQLMRAVPPTLQPTIQQYDLAWALMALGRDQEASALVEHSLREHPEDRGGVITSTRAIIRAKHGDVLGAESDIQSAISKGENYVHFHHTEYNIAVTYAVLRRPTAALPWLQRTVRDGWPCYPLFAKDPRLDPIRATPAFIAFLREQKAQWERYQRTL